MVIVNRIQIRLATTVALVVFAWLCVLSGQIVTAGHRTETGQADVAIVLGAAVYPTGPSPVFEERIKHGIHLYHAGVVQKLIFTGGYGKGAKVAEATVAEMYAIEHGVPRKAILTETKSRTTRENLARAGQLMRKNHFATAMVVSDPLHLKRALRMAADLGIDATGAATPTSRYRSWTAKSAFLLRELLFYHTYLVTGR